MLEVRRKDSARRSPYPQETCSPVTRKMNERLCCKFLPLWSMPLRLTDMWLHLCSMYEQPLSVSITFIYMSLRAHLMEKPSLFCSLYCYCLRQGRALYPRLTLKSQQFSYLSLSRPETIELCHHACLRNNSLDFPVKCFILDHTSRGVIYPRQRFSCLLCASSSLALPPHITQNIHPPVSHPKVYLASPVYPSNC